MTLKKSVTLQVPLHEDDAYIKYASVREKIPYSNTSKLVTARTSQQTDYHRILPKSQSTLNSNPYAMNFIQISKTWDKGNTVARTKILTEFVASNTNKTGPQLERGFANGASLFLTRITAWLRLTYLLGKNISLQLRAISIFVSASGGHRFLAEFLEIGGILTVLEILGLAQINDTDKADALRLLVNVANSGRVYKEFICESYGIKAVSECLLKTKSDIVADYSKNLLYQLGLGNPRFANQVYKSLLGLISSNHSALSQQMGAQTLRLLMPSIPKIHKAAVDAAFIMLKNTYVQNQYEAYEILKEILLKRPKLTDYTINLLINILRFSGEELDNESKLNEDEKILFVREPAAKNNNDKSVADNDHEISIFIQQSYAAKLLGVVAAMDGTLAQRMIDLRVVNGLLNIIANVSHPESQRYAVNTLQFLVENYKSISLADYMGQGFAEVFETQPDTFYKELNREQIKHLRLAASLQQHNDTDFVQMSDENVTSRSLLELKSSSVALTQSKDAIETEAKDEEGVPSLKASINVAGKSVSEEDPFNEDKRENEILETSMYVPFSVSQVKNTYAGTKFINGITIDSVEKITNDLEKIRANEKRKESKEMGLELGEQIGGHMSELKEEGLFKKLRSSLKGNESVPPEALAGVAANVNDNDGNHQDAFEDLEKNALSEVSEGEKKINI